jgi:methionyl-tRNA synthetase
MSRFYITTPIYYVSDAPHLGHAYTTVVCDTLARYQRLRGEATRFLTGTDDHGQKIARLAEQHQVTPRAYADKFADAYRAAWRALELSNDDFIRTTDPDHEAMVQEFWRRMEGNGTVYLADYEGWYCVACEQFYTEKELLPANRCPVHERPVDKIKEQSYYFRLSAFRDRLLALYDAHPEFIQPTIRRNEVRAFVEGELRDLSISRTTFKWGVPVPEHPGHVVYVWLDALINYYSATRRSDEAKPFWDAPDTRIVHVIGKEISRFHAVYWPAFLMAAGLRLPTTVFCHGWWTVDGQKMSKTSGNVVDPLRLAADVGVDAFRYFVLREIPLGADGDFSHNALITRYNAELANDLGNLLNRTLGMADKYFGGVVPPSATEELEADADAAREAVARELDAFAPSAALSALWGLVRRGNAYIDQTSPWKATPERQATILSNVLETLRVIGHLVSPFLPERAAELRRQLGLDEAPVWPRWNRAPVWRLQKGTPLFPRIEKDREAELLAKWAPKPNETASQPSAQPARQPSGQPASQPAPEPATDGLVTFDEFSRLDLRVARVVSAEPVPKAKKLLKLRVDLGGAERQVVAGIAESYRPEELVGKKVILLANLAPATIRGIVSEGMILAAGDEQVLALSGLDRDTPEGTKVR